MTTRIFSVVAGLAMALSVGLAAISKNLSQQFAAIGRKPVLLVALLAGLEAMLAFALSFAEEEPFVLFLFFSLLFLLAGVLHYRLIHSGFTPREGEKPGLVFVGELVFTLGAVVFLVAFFSLVEYFFRSREFLFYPLLFAGLFFLLPLLFLRTWELAMSIPPAVFAVWEYPIAHPLAVPDDNGKDRLLVIGFDLSKKLLEKKTFFRAKAPEDIRLGELFYHFINDYNELQSETPIHYIDGAGLPLSWGFRVKRKWYGRHRVLDPALTVKQNGIKENAVIICEHIILTN